MDLLGLQFNAPSVPIWVLAVVAVAIAVSPWIAARLRVPEILALLAAGFLIGPHALGVVDQDDTILAALGQLGLLYLMFMAGAELDFDVIHRHRRGVVGFSLLTFGIPMLLGVGIGWMFGYATAAALLIGSLWASHTLLAYSTVRSAGLTSRPSVATTVGATVVTDTLSLAVLAGVAGYATGSQSGVALGEQIVLGLLLLVAWSTLVLPGLTHFFYRRVSEKPTVRYVFVLAGLLSTAVLAQVVGVEGIVGAFFAGLGLNRILPAHSRIFERAEFLGAALLIPLFLISVGLIIDPSVMAAPATLALAAGFMVASFAGKGLAAVAGRWFFAYTWLDVGVVFGLTSASAARHWQPPLWGSRSV